MYNRTADLLEQDIISAYKMDESTCVAKLLDTIWHNEKTTEKANNLATTLINHVRTSRLNGSGVDVLLQEFKLSTIEGVALMCLAESLLRIPDSYTQKKLIKDKLLNASWYDYTKTDNLFVNAVSWGLLISNTLINKNEILQSDTMLVKLSKALCAVINRLGEPVILAAIKTAVKFMGNQFVMSEKIDTAISKAQNTPQFRYSYDMLGEAAMTDEDAMNYMANYIEAIHKVGMASKNQGVYKADGISVKLSAIHCRYTRLQEDKVMAELYPRLKQLFILAKQYQISLFIDAEESNRLMLSLKLFTKLLEDVDLQGFNGFGFVVQAYQKRALPVIQYLLYLANTHTSRIMVRLVKGAYWDSEIKKAQLEGDTNYSVFTRKYHTDLSYLACAQVLLSYPDSIYPLFATHNVHTLTHIYYMAININIKPDYEFQCLYGMGESLYAKVVGAENLNIPCRIYAPVGTYKTLLAYLVRRLLENGANSSFVHLIVDKTIPISKLLEDPILLSNKTYGKSNPYIPTPKEIYAVFDEDNKKFNLLRQNSAGFDFTDEATINYLIKNFFSNVDLMNRVYKIQSKIYHDNSNANSILHEDAIIISNPANYDDKIAHVRFLKVEAINHVIESANNAVHKWQSTTYQERAQLLITIANLLEKNHLDLMMILAREAGKTLINAINEIREAVDFCRYYALYAQENFINQEEQFKNLGIVVCISPWNFPLAIFLGEIVSALVTGNVVIAKPAEQTNIIASYVVDLCYKAGVPQDVLQLVLGYGHIVGNSLTADSRISGVIFTGSTEVAKLINQNLNSINNNKDKVLIAETGGQNAMIVDSSALPEQVVTDVITSAFDSAGQRCSALRVLYLQNEIADNIIHMLKGAMLELQMGNPILLSTDIGPVIDNEAKENLLAHIDSLKLVAKNFYQTPLNDNCNNACFVQPTLIEIDNISQLTKEVFGPIVHIIRYKAKDFDKIIDEINSSNYGLTSGIHSRIHSNIIKVYNNIHAGNIYVNRNIVGAVVGVQPFGGEGLSGTGPKAGGPLYLYRLLNTSKLADFSKHNQNIQTKLLPEYPILRTRNNKLDIFMQQLSQITSLSQDQIDALIEYKNNIEKYNLLQQNLVFKSSTGEYNFMFFVPRGRVLLLANNIFEYVKQLITVFLTNNEVALIYDNITQSIVDILPKSSFIYKSTDVSSMQETMTNLNKHINSHASDNFNVVMFSNDYQNKYIVKNILASKDGAIVNSVEQLQNNHYQLYQLLQERSVSINLAATGANLELMNISSM